MKKVMLILSLTSPLVFGFTAQPNRHLPGVPLQKMGPLAEAEALPSQVEDCHLDVEEVHKVTSLGYLVSYTVKFRNNTKREVDGVYWTAYFYNNANEKVKTVKESFNSGGIVDPIKSGDSQLLLRTPRVKGASKVTIVVDKIHFTQGGECES